jgi:hypothetical protein
LRPLPTVAEDPLASLSGSARFEPVDIDESLYCSLSSSTPPSESGRRQSFAFGGDFAAAGFTELQI